MRAFAYPGLPLWSERGTVKTRLGRVLGAGFDLRPTQSESVRLTRLGGPMTRAPLFALAP